MECVKKYIVCDPILCPPTVIYVIDDLIVAYESGDTIIQYDEPFKFDPSDYNSCSSNTNYDRLDELVYGTI